MSDASDFVIKNGILKKYVGPGGDVTIPDGVTNIGKAFQRCKTLTSVVIPEGVKKISDYAFEGCINLTHATIPEGVTSIGESAFEWCTSLVSVTIPSSLTSINNYAFKQCKSLSSISIPKSVSEIGVQAFVNCKKLQWIKTPVMPSLSITTNASFAVLLCGEKKEYYAYTAKTDRDNISDFVTPGHWNSYDLELINNGPVYEYKLPARFIGALGRLIDPVELSDEVRELYIEMLNKNAKKLVPIAEASGCVDLIRDLFSLNILDAKTETAVKRLLAASPLPELAALVEG